MARKGDRGSALTPPDLPFEPQVKVDAEVTPRCVEAGQPVTLEVITESGAAVAYQAVYKGNKGGSEPPFGAGYGGNDKGMATDRGHFTSTWAVRIDAPRGPARVDVIVGFEGEFGYAGPRFAVAEPGGSCPGRWFKEDD